MPNDEAQALWQQSLAAIGGHSLQRGAAASSPVERYSDPTRHGAETRALRRLPQAVGPAARVAQPGQWFSAQVLGVPLLLTHGADGEVRAFINVCRHRGASVVPGLRCGSDRTRFVCPYHSWTYDACGALVGRPHEADFPHLPRAAASLVRLPLALRFGLVWVVPEAVDGFDWDGYFGAMGSELSALGYDGSSLSPQQRSFAQPSNWKLVLDANLESYHFQYAHRATIAHLFHDNLVLQQAFGRHQRIVLPKRSLADAAPHGVNWELLGRHSNIIYFFFPSTLLLWEGDHLNGFCVTPTTPESCQTESWMLVPAATHARRASEYWQRNFTIFWDAIDEDFALAASIQNGLRSGANRELHFGRNEFACELFERAVEEEIGHAPGNPVP